MNKTIIYLCCKKLNIELGGNEYFSVKQYTALVLKY